MIRKPAFAWRSPPLALQIVALLLGGLVAAQLVTLFLTMLLPPAPTRQYSLDDIAAALGGAEGGGERGLTRILQAGPPDVSGPGWLVSETSRQDLARLMRVDERRVSLAFYTPLPFAGAAAPRRYAMADDGWSGAPVAAVRHVAFQLGASGGVPGGAGGIPAGAGLPPRDGFPPGIGLGGPGGLRARLGRDDIAAARLERRDALIEVQRGAGTVTAIPGDAAAAVPPILRGTGATSAQATLSAGTLAVQAQQAGAAQRIALPPELATARPGMPGRGLPLDGNLLAAPGATGGAVRIAPPLIAPSPEASIVARPPPPRAPAPDLEQSMLPAPLGIGSPLSAPSIAVPGRDAAMQSTPQLAPAGPPIAIKPTMRGLFGLAPAPFVEGDFVAALRISDGRWAVVQPAPVSFFSSWQRRVALWFITAFALVAPFGWLFARRLVKPLKSFAIAAEQLGRDPSAVIGELDGPAEIGRAAHAFNLMQNRLRSFVDDRTAMVGAISHDLRTPLTRMRFRIEDVPDDVRDGLLEEVDDMEAMIAEVISFIRDASFPHARERLDLGTLVEDVVEDARLVGGNVTIERSDLAPVEVDVLGMRRLLDNLLENAVKYGDRARIRLTTDQGSAVAAIIDDGSGLPEDELERVFEPFYRSDAARASEKAGSGLGLAVCRSIARAHGGDVRLRHSRDGFLAEVRVPLAFSSQAAPV